MGTRWERGGAEAAKAGRRCEGVNKGDDASESPKRAQMREGTGEGQRQALRTERRETGREQWHDPTAVSTHLLLYPALRYRRTHPTTTTFHAS